jgi:hypothetical protein
VFERVVNEAEARRDFPDWAGRLLPALGRVDPLADAAAAELAAWPRERRQLAVDAALSGETTAPAALVELVARASRVPDWVDWERVDRAGVLVRRAGVLGGITLGLRSLVFGYAAPDGNKPLALSGQLVERADRRLAETGRFVTDVTAPGALRPGQRGFATTLRVRLMHAQVRRLCDEEPRYVAARHGAPINQHDMVATILLFSSVFVDGIQKLGVHVTPEEADDYQHLFAWVGHVIGVEEGLLPMTHAEAHRAEAFVRLTQRPPDDDSRALVAALLAGPARLAQTELEQRFAQQQMRISASLCRDLIGDELADALAVPRSRWRRATRLLRPTMQTLERLRRLSPQLSDKVNDWGARYWEVTVGRGLAGRPAGFRMPEKLGR